MCADKSKPCKSNWAYRLTQAAQTAHAAARALAVQLNKVNEVACVHPCVHLMTPLLPLSPTHHFSSYLPIAVANVAAVA